MRDFRKGVASIGAKGPVSAETAWERYADPQLWSTWSPQIRSVETTTKRLTVGTTGTVHGPVGVRVNFKVTAFDDDTMRWAWSVQFGLIHLDFWHGVNSRPDEDGCSTWLKARGAWPVLAGYLPVARIALHRLVH